MLRRIATFVYLALPAGISVAYFFGVFKPDLVLAGAGLAVAGAPLMAFNKNPWELGGGVLAVVVGGIGIFIGDFVPEEPRERMVIVIVALVVSTLAILATSVPNRTAVAAEKSTRRSDFSLSWAWLRAMAGRVGVRLGPLARPCLLFACLVLTGSLAGDS